MNGRARRSPDVASHHLATPPAGRGGPERQPWRHQAPAVFWLLIAGIFAVNAWAFAVHDMVFAAVLGGVTGLVAVCTALAAKLHLGDTPRSGRAEAMVGRTRPQRRTLKRRRVPFDPLASQPRSPRRRPGNFNELTDSQLDPNVRFLGEQSGGGSGST